jgi:hypothetical protein
MVPTPPAVKGHTGAGAAVSGLCALVTVAVTDGV